ncbi:efflux RND transporter permease subunit [Nereida ignava]|uniref:Putative efflux pump membrane transporter TtgB n=1 Tax=Nereida ignava TaxID=282199 RepID=A0A0U1NL02_9RHOB|nr:efflux RND transporter permease subunit [Nereida ignava]CRK75397.1 putative efflux pump membrane transporter TtgB [Nereida ignava]SFJ54107.1 Multidrug efflux pump subunit AcrB [Nereida ignava DSM 16309]
MRDIGVSTGGVLSYFTRHKTAANLLLVVMLVLGAASLPKMRAQFFPDVVVDNVTVSVGWQGAGAEDVDAAIVQVVEPALLGVEGVQSSRAVSREGSASVTLDFEPGWDMSRAADDVQGVVDAISTLPEDADDPRVRRGTWRDRVTDVVITGPIGVEQLGLLADEFVNRLFAKGVTRATIRGVAAPNTVVEVNQTDLIRFDVTMADIAQAIGAEVTADPAGDVGATARVRTGVAKRDARAIAAIVLRSDVGGTALTIGDVAQVRVEGIDRERAYFVGDAPALSIRVDRSDQGDAINIQEQVQSVADEMSLNLPAGVSVELIRTRAEAISGRLNILIENGLTGLGLVVLLLFLFLNARTAFWVAAGIPVAMLSAIAIMYAAGLTINMISLFALIITLGIVVDDAIVVGEHADFRARRLGETPVVAAENAARRMASPVFSATVTTVIAFFGLVAIGGRFGDLISDIPFTVIAVLIASLVECFLILPHHMAGALAHGDKLRWYDLPSRTVNRGFDWFRETLFRPFIAGVIKARYPVFAGALVMLALSSVLFIKGDVQWRFFNAPERGSVTGNFAMVDSAVRADTLAQMRLMQKAIDELGAEVEARIGANPVDYVLGEIGGNAGRAISGSETKEKDQLGGVSIELIDADLRVGYSSRDFVSDLQDRAARHPQLEAISFRSWGSGPGGGDAIDVQFYGADAQTLKDASDALKEQLVQFPEVSAVEDDLPYDKEELILELTAKGQALGFTIDGLGRDLRARLNGIEAATYPVGARSATIRVELPEAALTQDFLSQMLVRSATGQYVPLADIVEVERRTGFRTVNRENGVALVSVTGELNQDDAARANEILDTIREVILPKIEADLRVSYEFSGASEDEDTFLNDARLGLMLSLLGIFLALAWVFGSWTRPVVVMAIIPFGLIGTIYGHWQWGVPLSMFTVVGLIGMIGIVINDSIVLVTTVDDYAKDRGLGPAIIDGVCDRLRPVLLTTLTTVLGLMPLLYETSSQAQFLKPTVITLVYGLGVGMALVLLIVPSLIAMQMDVRRLSEAARRAVSARGRFGARARGVVLPVLALGLMVALGFAATLGSVMATGNLAWGSAASAVAALGWFAGIVLGAGVLVFVATAIMFTMRPSKKVSGA